MDAMYWQPDEWSFPRLLLLGGTGSERRRAELDEHGGLRFRDRIPTGLKRMDVQYSDGTVVRTPHGARKVRRQRRANRIAKQARKVNR